MKISIITRSDKDPERRLWGDHWVKQELMNSLKPMGATFDDEKKPDLAIHLFGSPPKKALPEKAFKIVWVYSHPDRVDREMLKPFDHIFCASRRFTNKLLNMGYRHVEYCPACTSKKPIQIDPAFDIVFLGNARTRRPDGRKIVGDLLRTGHDFKVWGNLWEDIIPAGYYGGHYWDYEELDKLYASTRISLTDHHRDMAREGFVSNKVFDILACGGFVISDANAGLEDLFGSAAPQYESAEHLKSLLNRYLSNPEEREALRRQGMRIALEHTYDGRARRILEVFRNSP